VSPVKRWWVHVPRNDCKFPATNEINAPTPHVKQIFAAGPTRPHADRPVGLELTRLESRTERKTDRAPPVPDAPQVIDMHDCLRDDRVFRITARCYPLTEITPSDVCPRPSIDRREIGPTCWFWSPCFDSLGDGRGASLAVTYLPRPLSFRRSRAYTAHTSQSFAE
jgi:hypothetical protein